MINYTNEMCVTDFMSLATFSKSAFKEMGALASCACCSVESHGVVACEAGEGVIVMALCKTCLKADPKEMQIADWQMARDSYFDIPTTPDDRRKLIEMLRRTVIHSLAEQMALPAVMRMLELDHALSPRLPRDAIGVVVRQAGKQVRAFRCPVPWYPDDPFILGGKFARDASALVKSILAGKTNGYSFMCGPMMLTSSDNSLIKEWGKP
ncbi:MAG: hypothetical protein ABTQ26_14300 [Azonexus sp.]